MKRVALVLLLITVFACKNDKKGTTLSQDTKEAEEVLVDKNILSFIINAIVSQNDEFIVYYLDVNDKEIIK